MDSRNKCGIYHSIFVVVVLAIILAVAGAIAFFFIPTVRIKFAILVGFAVVLLIFVAIIVKLLFCDQTPPMQPPVQTDCFCGGLGALIFGIVLNTIVTLIAIVTTLSEPSVFGAVIIALWIFSFIITLGSFVAILICIKNKNCPDYDCNCGCSCNINNNY